MGQKQGKLRPPARRVTFSDFQDTKANETRLEQLNPVAEHLIAMGQTDVAEMIRFQIEDFSQRWAGLQQATQECAQTLGSTDEVQRYHRDADETKDWIDEKQNMLNCDGFDHDLATVRHLQRKHTGLKQDLGAIEEKVKGLGDTAQHLMCTYPDHAQGIFEHQAEINDNWNALTDKAAKLLDSYNLERFLSDFRDLTSWIKSMMVLVSSDGLAEDVTGAKVLLERHKENRVEIDAWAETLKAFEMLGHQLLQNNHYASDEVCNKLGEMAEARQDLEKAWISRRVNLDQCLELQLFNRDCEQAETWMAACEASLEGSTDGSGDSAEALLKKREDFDCAINSQEEKIADLKSFADRLIQSDHYNTQGIVRRRDEVLERWRVLILIIDNRAMQGETQSLQQISRDVDEMEIGITKKLQTAVDGPNKDPSNIQRLSCEGDDKNTSVAAMPASSADEVSAAVSDRTVARRLRSFLRRVSAAKSKLGYNFSRF